MKRILKIIPLVMIALLLSVISCQHDDATLQNEQVALQASQFTIKMKSGEHLREINPTVYQRLSETSRHTSSLSQTEDDTSMPSFTLDLSTIQIIERNTYTQYTTSVFGHSEYETYLINYLLLDFNDGAQYQFLVKYPRIFTNQGIILDRLNAVMERIEGDIERIFMTERYINPIAAALKKLDNNSYPIDYYKSYAWDGLRKWDAENLLSMTENQTFNNYRAIVEVNTSLSCN